jgi:hypothetical protein
LFARVHTFTHARSNSCSPDHSFSASFCRLSPPTVFVTNSLKRKLRAEFLKLCVFVGLELFDIGSDGFSYMAFLSLPYSKQANLIVPYSVLIVGSFTVSFALFLVRLSMFRELWRRRNGIQGNNVSGDTIMDLSDPVQMLAKHKRDITHTWVSVMLALMEDAPLLAINGYLLWINNTIEVSEPFVVCTLLFVCSFLSLFQFNHIMSICFRLFHLFSTTHAHPNTSTNTNTITHTHSHKHKFAYKYKHTYTHAHTNHTHKTHNAHTHTYTHTHTQRNARCRYRTSLLASCKVL